MTDSIKEVCCTEADKQKEISDLIDQVEAPPEVKEKIRQTITMSFLAMSQMERRPPLSPEAMKIATEFLIQDSQNNKEIALREIEASEKSELLEAEAEKEKRRHAFWNSKIITCAGLVIAASVLIFAGYLVLAGDKQLGERIIGYALAFAAGMGIRKLLS